MFCNHNTCVRVISLGNDLWFRNQKTDCPPDVLAERSEPRASSGCFFGIRGRPLPDDCVSELPCGSRKDCPQSCRNSLSESPGQGLGNSIDRLHNVNRDRQHNGVGSSRSKPIDGLQRPQLHGSGAFRHGPCSNGKIESGILIPSVPKTTNTRPDM